MKTCFLLLVLTMVVCGCKEPTAVTSADAPPSHQHLSEQSDVDKKTVDYLKTVATVLDIKRKIDREASQQYKEVKNNLYSSSNPAPDNVATSHAVDALLAEKRERTNKLIELFSEEEAPPNCKNLRRHLLDYLTFDDDRNNQIPAVNKAIAEARNISPSVASQVPFFAVEK